MNFHCQWKGFEFDFGGWSSHPADLLLPPSPPPYLVYQTCRSAAIGRPSCNRTARWWRYRDERRPDVCTQPSRHRHRCKWPREGGSWRGGTRNGGELERWRPRWWELKGGDEIRGGEGGRSKSARWEDQPPFILLSHINKSQ